MQPDGLLIVDGHLPVGAKKPAVLKTAGPAGRTAPWGKATRNGPMQWVASRLRAGALAGGTGFGRLHPFSITLYVVRAAPVLALTPRRFGQPPSRLA